MSKEELNYSEMSDRQLKDAFEGHECSGDDSCELCFEYMSRFNPERLEELGINEPREVDEI